MKKEVYLCEECYAKGKEIVCDNSCYFCGKSICKNCEKKLIIEFKKTEYETFRTFNIAPLCESCLNSFSSLKIEFYQNLVNLCAKAFFNQAKKEKELKSHIKKSIEEEITKE